MSDLKIGRMTIGTCATNCYFLYRENKHDCIVIDPADAGAKIYDALTGKGFTIKGILLTHGHFDHIWGAEALRKCANTSIYALDEEKELLNNSEMNVSEMAGRACCLVPDVFFKDGDELKIGDFTCKIIATPGHTQGSCCFYFEEAGFAVCGDTIFMESVGRTDFPTGSSSKLINSIREKIFTLPDEVILYPGHGDSTSVEHEKQFNPYA